MTALPVGVTTFPAYLEIVLDGSGSMSIDGKWEAAVAAHPRWPTDPGPPVNIRSDQI